MAGKTLDLDDIINRDQLGCQIANMFHMWDNARDTWKRQRVEVRQYVYATDTLHTSGSSLPWSNKTHIPKLCQIRDNLFANYVSTLFPKRKWLKWEGHTAKDEHVEKTEAIKDYMSWVISQKHFKDEVYKLIADYLDDGNTVVTAEWVDETTIDPRTGLEKPGYVGPKVRRINPFDVVVNPIAPSWEESPKIVRSMWTKGEAKLQLERLTSTEDQKEIAQGVWDYIDTVREQSLKGGDFKEVDEYLNMDGFGSYKEYLGSNYVELLEFNGNIYSEEEGKLYRNYQIVVVDRHKVILKKPHDAPTGEIPVYHSGWRIRQDNLWAMGPLDNLVGMQYRINHIENMKADIFDLTVFPPLKIKGMVEDFEWGPFERIYVDQDGDVDIMSPKAEVLQANIEIQGYENRMEEMAGSPREAMGFRTPGEKTAYEVQRLENAASRIFQNKIGQFEEQILEPLLNYMLALAQANLTDATIRIIDDEFKASSFRNITAEELSANGRMKPVGARHFAEKAEQVQNLNNFYNSAAGADESIKVHFSGLKTAMLFEELLGLEDFEIVSENIRITEQAETAKMGNIASEEVEMEAQTPAGIAEDDFDEEEIDEQV